MTSPMGHHNFAVQELFDLDKIQILQDSFAKATGVASIITNVDGSPMRYGPRDIETYIRTLFYY